MSNYPSVDESFVRLRRAGWSIGEAAGSVVWIITGTHGENVIRAEGKTQAESWYRVVLQAEVVPPDRPLTITSGHPQVLPGRFDICHAEAAGGCLGVRLVVMDKTVSVSSLCVQGALYGASSADEQGKSVLRGVSRQRREGWRERFLG